MRWRCWLLGHCCPCGVPNRLEDWTAEHDVAEGGQLLLNGEVVRLLPIDHNSTPITLVQIPNDAP